MKKKNAVMLADTRPALVGTVLLQIQKTNPNLFDEAIIYYVDEIMASDREIMCDIMPCRFVQYVPPLPESLFVKPRFSRFSSLMFCRYEMFSYLTEFETITWLDTDILIQGDLSRLIDFAKISGAALIREDPVNKTAENPDRMRTCFTTKLPDYRMDDYLYCSGTIVFTDKLTVNKDYTRWCYSKTIEWADILSLPDQGVINAAIQAFDIKVTAVSGKTYCCYPALGRDCSGAVIVHAWGSNKFWNDWYLYLHYPAWGSYYEAWQGMGGSSLGFAIEPLISVVIPVYKPELALFKQCMDSLMQQNRDNWERFSDFEIIIIAEPFEQEVLQKFIDDYRDKRIRLKFNDERLGIAASLNRGLRLAKGKYIARVDDDDICAPARLYLQAEYLDKHSETSLCTSDFEYFGDMNERRVSFAGELARAWSVLTCPFDHPTIMFRRDFFVDNNLFYDEQRGYVEDWELWLRAFAKGLTVGCIHRVLYYHRWLNSGSAGQTSKTVDMMRDLVQQNFARLGVEIASDDLPIIGPWNGRLMEADKLSRLEEYFSEALENNQKLCLYDQKNLVKVFELRLAEAKTGVLPGLSESTQQAHSGEKYALHVEQNKPNILKRAVKAVFKPLYRPFRHRYEDRLIDMQNSSWRNEGHLLNCIEKLDRIVVGQQAQIEALRQHLDKTQLELEALLLNQSLDTRQELSAKLFAEAENTRKELSAKLFTEAENTRQELSAKLFTEAENTRQELSAKTFAEAENTRQELSSKLFTEAENTRQELSSKLFTEAENTRQELSAKVFTEAENTRQELSAKLFTEAENTRGFTENKIYQAEKYLESDFKEVQSETHRHIDFTYRDIMVALQQQQPFLPANNVRLETEYPVAYESLDHLYPHGTIRDNTRYPRFVEKCEELLLPKRDLAFLDLGCSGGGMVLEAALRGHLSMGLEGSDCSKKEQRAEWRLLGDRLQTCDIAKPFYLRKANNEIQQFDIITAWEVLEHIAEVDLPQLFANIKNHLTDEGYFVGSIANWDDIDPVSGVNWHVTVHLYEWWADKFSNAGFKICTEDFAVIDLARGGYNPPHCYEQPYPEVDLERSLYIAVHE